MSKTVRASWRDYGISRKRYIELKTLAQSGEYSSLVRSAAYMANKDIAEYIILSVTKNKSYEGVEFVEGLRRIPCGRTDFYGYRRLFYHLFDEKLRLEKDETDYEQSNSYGSLDP